MSARLTIPRRSSRIAALGAIAAMLCVALTACAQGPHVAIVAPNGTVLANVAVEIAATEQQRETGLMYRSHLGANDGMLFLFTHPQPLQFWMKNTEIPLDMIFADGNRVVAGTVQRAEPYSEQLLSVDGETQYVLEVNGGFCAQHGIKAGDHLRFEGVDVQPQD